MIASYICPNLKVSDTILFEEEEILDILIMTTKNTETSSQTISEVPKFLQFPFWM